MNAGFVALHMEQRGRKTGKPFPARHCHSLEHIL